MRFCGDPEALASALEKLEAWSRQIPLPVNPAVSSLFIVEPLTDFSLENIFSAHPTTEARVTSPALSSATAFILYGRRKLQGPSKGVWRFLPASLVKVSLGVRRHNS